MAANIAGLVSPAVCTVDFSLVPIGAHSASFSRQIADVQRLMQQSGLKYQMHATGTTVEGPWDQVARIIGYSHTLLHQEGIARIQTDIRMITRTDKVKPMEESVVSVERLLAT
ncbi:hypothetical protein P175DRAFT_0449969 [Aspergillus ochraceoroseus IBT 24754]|uniref:Thiamine-binding protein domain-containing protein n=3 Tax=Aspergillus subgen. Nidulantes TaxID=2720870 RepID=A0A0F8XUZ8_9EURO|nr:uncharacterized protein P175DRAFT_0449969 [Aspergillus ochraceoroseus IBT 24754]KKK16164.1 hypothetical protein AOCH_002150 [Aspergillus ochraceoroseus]KKK27297.1 hypothetical protein ARAM_001953 [Aspergillus rambellii]PTU24443.1 hypothetical protein P175DRAFT_0449969 [Aspergillus ochraceoroseus IBT 24754]